MIFASFFSIEKLHHSYFYYLLLGDGYFLGINEYGLVGALLLCAFLLLYINLLIYSISSSASSKNSGEDNVGLKKEISGTVRNVATSLSRKTSVHAIYSGDSEDSVLYSILLSVANVVAQSAPLLIVLYQTHVSNIEGTTLLISVLISLGLQLSFSLAVSLLYTLSIYTHTIYTRHYTLLLYYTMAVFLLCYTGIQHISLFFYIAVPLFPMLSYSVQTYIRQNSNGEIDLTSRVYMYIISWVCYIAGILLLTNVGYTSQVIIAELLFV